MPEEALGGEVARSAPLYEQVYQVVRKALLQGRIAPGSRVTELRLAAELGVSRTPVREALRQLQQEGLLTTDEQGRLVVPVPNAEDVADLYECRIVLEVFAARRAAVRIRDEDLAAMEEALEAAERAIAEGEPLEALTHNARFHDILAQAGGNRRLVDLLRFVRAHILYMRAMVIQGTAPDGVQQEHRRILECLRRRDPDAAAEAVRRHLEADLARFTAHVRSAPAQAGGGTGLSDRDRG